MMKDSHSLCVKCFNSEHDLLKTKDRDNKTSWCPLHGYPLPCEKCGNMIVVLPKIHYDNIPGFKKQKEAIEEYKRNLKSENPNVIFSEVSK
jgi:hypothetical protein